MEIYKKCEPQFDLIANQYKKPGETPYISLPILFEGQKYREILYYKTFLGKPKKDIEGVIYVNEDGILITDMSIKRELAYITCKLDTMINAYRGGLTKAIVKESDIARDRRDNDQMIKALNVLKEEGMMGTDTVIEVLTKLPDMKIENNESIDELSEKLKSVGENAEILTQEMINEIEPIYTKVLIKNFTKIKLINKGRKYYNEIKSASDKKRSKVKYRFMGKDITEGLRKMEYGIGYLKKVLEIYDKIADMSEEKYREFLKNLDKNQVNKRLELIR